MGNYPGGTIIKVAPTVAAGAFGATDLIFDKQEIKLAVASRGGSSLLQNVSIHADVATDVNLAILFFDNSTGIGAAANDATTAMDDAEFQAAGFIGGMNFDGGENTIAIGNGLVYMSSLGNETAGASGNMPLLLSAVAGERSIWFTAHTLSGTPTYDANSLSFTFNFQYLD